MKKLYLFFALFLQTAIYPIEFWKGACETDFPPYNYQEDGQNIGMDTDIVNLVMKKLKIQYSFDTYPFARVISLLELGQIDFAWQFVDSPERREKFNLAGPIRFGTTVLMVEKNFPLKDWSGNFNDLTSYSFGVVRGFKYISEFDNNLKLHKEESNNNQYLVLKLVGKRIDIAIGDLYTLQYIAKISGNEKNVRFLPTKVKKVPRYIGFHKKEKAKADQFQKALDSMINSKEYHEIITKYTY